MKNLLVVTLFSAILFTCVGCPNKTDQNGNSGANIQKKIDKLMKSGTSLEKATKLPPLAVDLAKKMRDTAGAKKVMEDALRACGEITEPQEKCEAYSKIAEAYGKLDDRSGAKNALKKAREAVENLPGDTDTETKISLYAGIAAAQGAMSESADAGKTLEEALALTEKIDPISRVNAVCELTAVAYKIKSEAAAEKASAVIHEMVDAAEDARTKNDFLARLAAVQLKAKQKDVGEKTLDESAKHISEIPELGRQAVAYCELIKTALDADLKEKASELFKKADKTAEAEKDDSLRQTAREAVGELKSRVK